MLLPWTPLLVRRVRDATGSNNAAVVSVLVAYGSLIAAPMGIATPIFQSLAALGFLTIAVVSSRPTVEPGIPDRDWVVAGARPEYEQSEADDAWER